MWIRNAGTDVAGLLDSALRAEENAPAKLTSLCRRFPVQPVGVFDVQIKKPIAQSIAFSKRSIQIRIALKQIS